MWKVLITSNSLISEGNLMKKEIISKELLDILICPRCKSDIELIEYRNDQGRHPGLKCTKCKLIYPVKEGIPVMLIEEAIKE